MFRQNNDTNITFGIIGLNDFGRELAISLANAGKEIMVVDTEEDAVQDLSLIHI